MAIFKLESTDYNYITINGVNIRLTKKEALESFNESILGLEQIDIESTQIDAISVMFDLEGFTKFCSQTDPQHVVPSYLSRFLKWLFEQIRIESIRETYENGYQTWSDFPFLAKFMGDGVLFIWNTEEMNDIRMRNVVESMLEICGKYERDFLPSMCKEFASPPRKLRCGIARGAIYSIGNGQDYVGPCINMSARLQKLYSLSFCFSPKGLSLSLMHETVKRYFVTKKILIRGIDNAELVCIYQHEFDALDGNDRAKFEDV